MPCASCGSELSPGMTFCPNCGAEVVHAAPLPSVAPAPGTNIPNYLLQSILVTLCCCMPFGAVSIIYAAQVTSKIAAGDLAGAQLASKNAKMWFWIALISGVIVIGIAALNGITTLVTDHR